MSPLSNEPHDKEFVRWDDLHRHLESYHKRRWMALGIWVLLFSLIVTGVLVYSRRISVRQHTDRSEQIAAIVVAGHDECVHAFTAMTTILHTSISNDAIARATPAQKKLIAHLFALADPVKNCPPSNALTKQQKKILRQVTTTNKKGT